MKLLLKLKCFWYGHTVRSTGRSAVNLYEVVCWRCHGRYVANVHEPNILLPADKEFDRFVADLAVMEDAP